jgi:MFS family permease
LNGSVLALSFAAAVVVLGFGIIMPFLPVYAQILGASTGLEIGLLSSAFLLTRTFLATFTGSASDRYGRKKIIIGLLIYTIVSILFGLSQSWFELLLYRAVQGVASAMVWTPATALVADLTPPGSRGTAMGLYNSISMGGWVIGPALGGGIQWYARNVMMMPLTESFRIPFYFSSLTSLIAILLVAFLVRMPADYKPSKRPLTKISLRGVDKRFKSTIYAMFFLLFAYGFATSFIEPLLVYFVQHEYGLSADEVTSSMAIIFSVSGVLMLAIQIYAGRLADRFSKKKIIAIPTGLA